MADIPAGELIACHECDHLHRYVVIPAGARANCDQCGSFLYRNIPDSLNRSLALYSAAFLLFLLANCFPFLSLTLGGRVVENVLLSGGWAMYEMGMSDLGILIFLTSIGFPLIAITGMLYLLVSVKLGFVPPAMGRVYRVTEIVTPWSLVSVFMLGVLIAIVKLQDIANVIIGTSFFALCGLLLVYAAARANFDPRVLWSLTPYSNPHESELDSSIQYLNCHTCGLLAQEKGHSQHCLRCTTPLHHRKHNSIESTWALLIAAAILIIPANLYPVMTVIRFGQGEPNTILSGVLHLIESGMWGLALIVFVASIVVPVMKLIVLSFLLISVQKKSLWRPRDRTLLYRITEVVGAWSMVDIFLVGLLSALVSLDALSTIRPGIGASFFGAVVVVTMFAAHKFDSRLIWDNMRESNSSRS
ncbi:MAG: PqiA/YebS family transporter subunit [Gammaproteobacteria bacterium]|nr:PqiA/YebS family transporter subunit [Gammaproteobacteria bacterium]